MLADIFGVDSIYVLIIAVVLLFGGNQLPKLARNAGEAMKEFRKAHNEATNALGATSSPGAGLVGTGPSAASTMAAQPAAQPEERVTLTRAELDTLLADRESRAAGAGNGRAPVGADLGDPSRD